MQTSELDRIIAPEIKDDQFYRTLGELASNETVKTILEIGSSSGGGSTQAFVEAIRRRPDADTVHLFCMEVSRARWGKLAETYRSDRFVHAYNVSSVALSDFPTPEEVTFFYNATRTNLNQYPLETVLGWLQQDIDYVKSSGNDSNGIVHIKKLHGIRDFDLVLIDGSEFTGERELSAVMGARFIALDDVNAHKCFNCYNILKSHVHYSLVGQDLGLRNGFAVFARRY